MDVETLVNERELFAEQEYTTGDVAIRLAEIGRLPLRKVVILGQQGDMVLTSFLYASMKCPILPVPMRETTRAFNAAYTRLSFLLQGWSEQWGREKQQEFYAQASRLVMTCNAELDSEYFLQQAMLSVAFPKRKE